MQLTEADKKKVAAWLTEKCGQMRCFCCGTARFTLFDIGTLAIGFDVRSTRFFYHQGIPQVTVACENCGHLLNFSPMVMGIQPDAPPPAPDAPKQ